MRRKDREMDIDFGYGVIDKARFGVLSMMDVDDVYGLPLSIVRDGDILYFHSAKSGRKVSALESNPRVCVTFVGDVNIPELYTEEELSQIVSDKQKAASITSTVFTTEFESAIVKGNVELVVDDEERVAALRKICEKYTPTKMEYFDIAIQHGLKLTNVYRIKIDEVSAKRKKFDAFGKELKNGRME